MKPIDPANWLTPDTEADVWLPQKHALMANRRNEVFFCEEGASRAASEASQLVFDHVDAEVQTDNQFETMFECASALVSDDLCVMTDQGEAFCLSVASLCTPTFWSLADKAGQPLSGLHSPVPGGDPKLAARIYRIFRSLQSDMVLERFNWTVQLDGERFTPSSEPMKRELASLSAEQAANRLFLRVERQTIRKLPETGAVLFTIRICVDPLPPILKGPANRQAFEKAWSETDPALAEYKGWPHYEAAVRHSLEAR